MDSPASEVCGSATVEESMQLCKSEYSTWAFVAESLKRENINKYMSFYYLLSVILYNGVVT